MIFDDYLRKKIKKVFDIFAVESFYSRSINFDAKIGVSLFSQSEDELLAEQKCVAHLTGEVSSL